MSRRFIPLLKWASILLILTVTAAMSAPYAAIVIDADSGEVLYEHNADNQLHPAGLTKLMTLYAAFDAIETGMVSLDDKITISRKAQAEPPVKLGLRAEQTIKLRYLLRAAAVQGANDAATAIGEGLDGKEDAFAIRMNGYSKELGMTGSSWKNAHGLPVQGHQSTARDLAILFVANERDFPDYFNLFSRIRTHAGLREVSNSSRRMLGSIKGIQGAKYGYSRKSRHTGAAFVQRGDKKVVGVVLGAISLAALNRSMHDIIDDAFAKD